MAAVVKNLRDGIIRIFDGTTGTRNEIEIVCDAGDLTFTPPTYRKAKVIMDRGTRSHLRGDAQDPSTSGSFTVQFKEFLKQDSNPITPYEALAKKGGAAAWVSTNDDGGGVDTIGIEFEIVTPTSTEQNEIITFSKCFNIKIEFSEADEANTLKVSFEHFGEPAIAKSDGSGSGSGSGA